MSFYVTHAKISDNHFDTSAEPEFMQVSNMDEVVEYFDRNLGEQIAEIRRNQLLEAKEALSKTTLFGLAEQQIGEASPDSFIDLDLPHHVEFYKHPNFTGSSFKLGVVHQTHPIVAVNPVLLSSLDWDSNLARRENGRWDNQITSVECHYYAKYWVICEHPNFQGRKVFGVGDEKELHKYQGGVGNDISSSMAINSISSEALVIGLRLLLGL